MKKLLLLALFAVCLTPNVAKAGGRGGDPDGWHHRKIGAPEMATAGFAAAAMLGVAGFLVLRRRTAN